MTEETVKVTVRMPDDLLEGLDDLYGDEGPYEDRTEVVVESIAMLIEGGPSEYVDRQYDALVAEYVKALGNHEYDSAQEAKEDILEYFPETRLAAQLEPDDSEQE